MIQKDKFKKKPQNSRSNKNFPIESEKSQNFEKTIIILLFFF